MLENVVYDPATRAVDFESSAITENTRAAYPIEHIANAKTPCTAGHPRNVIFLTCDASGVLPPVSRLSREQAMYHFLSGYTARVAGTEMGIVEPQVAFSACFSAAFLVRHPAVYARLLADRLARHGARAWLVNTGWTGGGYGQGRRIDLAVWIGGFSCSATKLPNYVLPAYPAAALVVGAAAMAAVREGRWAYPGWMAAGTASLALGGIATAVVVVVAERFGLAGAAPAAALGRKHDQG